MGGVTPGASVALRSEVGPLKFAFTGAAASWAPGTATLAFSFTRVAVALGDGAPFYEKDLGARPARTYQFFAASVRRAGVGAGAGAGAGAGGGAVPRSRSRAAPTPTLVPHRPTAVSCARGRPAGS